MANKIRWIIVGLFGVIMVVIIIKVVMEAGSSVSQATDATTGPGKLAVKYPLKPVTLVLPAAPSEGGDAGDDYQQAMTAYESSRTPIEEACTHVQDIVEGKYRLSESDLAAMAPVSNALAAGARKKDMCWYFRLTPRKLTGCYDALKETKRFEDLANVPVILAYNYLYAGPETYALAEKALFDMVAMGNHMVEERARVDIIASGVGLQNHACKLLKQLYKKWQKPARSDQMDEYTDGLSDISGTYLGHRDKVIWRIPPQPGDIFNLAANHADRAVRVEAILGLGYLKLAWPAKGDQARTRELINRYLASSDPIQQEAAKVADAMTQDDLRRLLRGGDEPSKSGM